MYHSLEKKRTTTLNHGLLMVISLETKVYTHIRPMQPDLLQAPSARSRAISCKISSSGLARHVQQELMGVRPKESATLVDGRFPKNSSKPFRRLMITRMLYATANDHWHRKSPQACPELVRASRSAYTLQDPE